MKRLLFFFFLLLTSVSGWAHDFYVDGIYYYITEELTAAVTCKDNEPSSYSDRYSGNVVIPDSVTFGGKTYRVTVISDGAFQDCESVTSVSIPGTVTELLSAAFHGCTGLTSVVIPDGVTYIGRGAFRDCTGLTSLAISSTVTSIRSSAFYGCALEWIVVDADNPVYDSRDNCNAIIETASNTLIVGCKNTVIPNSVTTIDGAFSFCTGLTSVTIPDNVTEIGGYAFQGCTALTSVIIPGSVTAIGYNAFDGCTALKDVYCSAENVPTTEDAFSGVDLSSVMLHVPAVSLEVYRTTAPWSLFGQIVAIGEGDSIEQLTSETLTNPTVCDLGGRRMAKIQKGINLLRNADGRVKKVLRK